MLVFLVIGLRYASSRSTVFDSKTRSFSQRKSDPVITVYETQANLADHEKIQGTDGKFNTTQS